LNKPNILLIVVDAFRADKLYDDVSKKTAKTPFLDELLKKSTYFTRAFSTTSTTTPSFTSILTGLYPPNHGVRSLYGYKLKKNIKTLPSILGENGYNTYAEVTGPLLPLVGLDNGFMKYNHRETSKTYYSSWGDELLNKFRNGHFKEPWFIMLHFWELHGPRYVNKSYDNNRYGLNKYERALSGLDSYLNKLISTLSENDLCVITGDHGEEVAKTVFHRLIYKRLFKIRRALFRSEDANTLKKMGHGHNVYDRLIRIPLILKSNKWQTNGQTTRSLVSQVDITPTILKTLNIQTADYSFDGLDLLEISRGNIKRNYIFSEACGETIPNKQKWKVGLRTNKYKYIMMPYSNDIKEELYNIEEDNKERKNIAKENPELTEMFRYLIYKNYLK
jgi:arylsulfatase A-like enzyme